jgi:hypothetical protein
LILIANKNSWQIKRLTAASILENNLKYLKDKKIILIIDYLSDLVIKYIRNILNRHDIIFIISSNIKSTSSGIKEALQYVNDEAFAILWSDLYLKSDIDFSFNQDITIGLTNSFNCRYKLADNTTIKESSNTNGIMGIFLFGHKKILENNIDESMSFVGHNLKKLEHSHSFGAKLYENIIEIGNIDTYESLLKNKINCRFFNQVEFTQEDTVIKKMYKY